MSMPEMVTLTIDGRTATVPKGTLLVEAARTVGIEIPVFCYHPKLDPAGVCRMCLVQIEKFPRPVTACTAVVGEGMVVHTQSELAQTVQQGVLEFLLLNHPLDCPVCDKGGECPLQDNTLHHGPGQSRNHEPKLRKHKAVELGPFIVLDQERCILCRRCTRFDDEIAAEGNLIIGERGHENVVTTLEGRPYDSYFGGNTIELCPVGALTAELYRFKSRPWDLSRTPAVCTGCSVGCNVELHFRHGEFVRVVSRENPETDGGWICDRGRFNYLYANDPTKPAPSGRGGFTAPHPQRLSEPLVRKDGQLVPVTWTEALQTIASRMNALKQRHGGSAIGVIGGGRLTLQEGYLLQKLARAVFSTHNVDHRVAGQAAAALAAFPGRQTDINTADAILVVDLLPAERAPVLDLRVRRAIERRRARLVSIGAATPQYRTRTGRLQVRPGDTAAALAAVAAELASRAGDKKAKLPELPAGVEAAAVQQIAGMLAGAARTVVLWGGEDPAAGQALLGLLSLVNAPKEGRTAHLLIPGEQSGSRGAAAMGCLPGYLPGYKPVSAPAHRQPYEKAWGVKLSDTPGLDTPGMLAAAAEGRIKALYLAGANLALTWPDGPAARAALNAVDFLVVQDLFLTETAQLADVVLPAAAFPAKTGHMAALDGLVQQHRADPAMHAGGQSRPDAAVFGAVSLAMTAVHLKHTDREVGRELESLVGVNLQDGLLLPGAPVELLEQAAASWPAPRHGGAETADGELDLVPVERLYSGGGTAAHDPGVADARPEAAAVFHPADLKQFGLAEGDPVRLSAGDAALDLVARGDKRVRPGSVQVPRGLPEAPANRLGPAVRVTVARRVAEVVG